MELKPVTFTAQTAEVDPQTQARLKAAAQEFEAMFLGQMANEMLRDTMPKTMNGGFGEEMFRSMLGDEFGRQLARSGGIGLSDEIYRSLLERVEK